MGSGNGMDVRSQNGAVTFSSELDSLRVTLHRTLRLPEDDKTHALPPSLGHFPVKLVDEYKNAVPPHWVEHGGVFLPMWQREAMWLQFHCAGRPAAIKVAAGKVDAVSGEKWEKKLTVGESGKENYMVAPPQPWLDGFNSGNGIVKQFVAMPLGMGYTVEKQVTGKEDVGGIQILCFFPKEGRLTRPFRRGGILRSAGGQQVNSTQRRSRSVKAAEMGLGAGGRMRQKIYPDPYGVDVWDQENGGKVFIHIVNSQMYGQITGEKPPASPITAQTYTDSGLPWFDLWDEEMGDIGPSSELAGVQTIAEVDKEKGFEGQQDDSPVEEKNIKKQELLSQYVRTGNW